MSNLSTLDDEVTLLNILWKEMEDLKHENGELGNELERVKGKLRDTKGLLAEAFQSEMQGLRGIVSSVIATKCIPLTEANDSLTGLNNQRLDQLRQLSEWIGALEEKEIELTRKMTTILPPATCHHTCSLTKEVARTMLEQFKNQVSDRMPTISPENAQVEVAVQTEESNDDILIENDNSPTDADATSSDGLPTSDQTVACLVSANGNTQRLNDDTTDQSLTSVLESERPRRTSQRSAAVVARAGITKMSKTLKEWTRDTKN